MVELSDSGAATARSAYIRVTALAYMLPDQRTGSYIMGMRLALFCVNFLVPSQIRCDGERSSAFLACGCLVSTCQLTEMVRLTIERLLAGMDTLVHGQSRRPREF